MGYTHYWTLKKTQNKKVEDNYQKAIIDCNILIKYYYKENKGTVYSLSGYSAHSEGYSGINFNGKGHNSHESFILRENYKKNETFNFCKTKQKPYDTLVVACLVILKYHLKENIKVSSDGYFLEWIEGTNLAKKLFKDYNLYNPIYTQLKRIK